MKRYIAPAAAAVAILLSSVSVDAILAPAAAQEMDVSFDSFHDYLANYGDWVYSDRWGEVWVPENVSDDFQPYGTNGYWAATDEYGWVWVSNYEWGDVPFHYGRWVNDPDIGWLWIPGYVWSPAWVVWRHNGSYTGWMPMPPDDEFLGRSSGPSFGIGISLGRGLRIGLDFNDTSSYYGYSQWYPDYDENRFARNWVFVPTGHLADRDANRYWAPRGGNVTIIHNTTNITNYTVVNNYVVNRGVDPRVVEKAGGRPVQHVQLAQVIKHPNFVAPANRGVEIQARMRQENPHGNGQAGSAPRPSDKLVQGLSNNVPQHQGHAPMHVFTKQTVTQAPAFTGKPAPGGMMHGPGGAMSGPNGGTNAPAMREEHKPAETGGASSGGGGAMMQGPGGSMSGPNGGMNAPGMREEHRHEIPGGGASSSGGGMQAPGGSMSGPNGGMNAPAMREEHRHDNMGGGSSGGGMMMQGPGGAMSGPNGGMNAPAMREEHRHDNMGGGSSGGGMMMQGPGGAISGPNGGMNAPAHRPQPTGGEGGSMNAPMMHRHENTGGGAGGNAAGGGPIGAGGPMHGMDRRPPVTTRPVEHAVTPHNPPAGNAPPKNEEKDKKHPPG